jgi:hypothetical protein
MIKIIGAVAGDDVFDKLYPDPRKI